MNKKRITLIIALIIGSPIIAYITLSFFGILKIYSNPSTANEPNLKINSKMFVSNLITPEIGDFICFDYYDEMYDFGRFIKVNRLCAMEHDTIEIRDGIVYLNNINIDKKLNLNHFYKLDPIEFSKLKKEGKIMDAVDFWQMADGQYMTSIEDRVAKNYEFESKRVFELKGQTNDQVYKVFNENWNKDNLGPLIIPENKFFVLGDNRDNSIDSRITGLHDVSDIIGVVVGK